MYQRLTITLMLLALLMLSACGTAGPATSDQQATDRFMAERGESGPPAERPVVGTIDQLGDGEMVVNSIEGGSVTIQLPDDAAIVEQVQIAPSDLAVGTSITAFGEYIDGQFTPRVVQTGDSGSVAGQPNLMLLGGPPGAGPGGPVSPNGGEGPRLIQRGGPGGPQGGEGAPIKQLEVISGTVERVTEASIELTDASGARTSIAVGPELRIEQMQPTTLAALTPGREVVVTGTQEGTVFSANQVRLVARS